MTNKSMTALALILAATTAPAVAQTTYSFSDVDQDENLELDAVELEALGREVFVIWDQDQDQVIGEGEFYSGLYQTWDADADAVLTDAEYQEGWSTWFGDADQVAYDQLDLNADAELAQDEFTTALGEVGLYDAYTGGTEFGEDQFMQATRNVYGTDGQTVTQDEFASVGLYGTEIADMGAGTETTVVETEILEPQAETAEGMEADAEMGETGLELGEAGAGAIEAEVISLDEWGYEPLYTAGTSAEEFFGSEVYGLAGEELGEVEDLIIGADGQILAVVAEVGGFIDIGDTHVSVPWDEVEVTETGIAIPVTEETIGEYGFYDPEMITAEDAATEVVSEVDDVEAGPQVFRLQELIGDYVRMSDAGTYRNYGYVNDVILADGRISAVVVEPSFEYGGGYFAYPYYGLGAGYGWTAGSQYYDLPYGEPEVGAMEPFEYEQLGAM